MIEKTQDSPIVAYDAHDAPLGEVIVFCHRDDLPERMALSYREVLVTFESSIERYLWSSGLGAAWVLATDIAYELEAAVDGQHTEHALREIMCRVARKLCTGTTR